jgi:hypothetical protein
MNPKLPPDLARAERAYSAFYNEQPQIFFSDLSHEAKMRWVNAVRAALGEKKKQIMKLNGGSGHPWSAAQRKKFMRTQRLKKQKEAQGT